MTERERGYAFGLVSGLLLNSGVRAVVNQDVWTMAVCGLGLLLVCLVWML